MGIGTRLTVSLGCTRISKCVPLRVFTVSFMAAGGCGGAGRKPRWAMLPLRSRGWSRVLGVVEPWGASRGRLLRSLEAKIDGIANARGGGAAAVWWTGPCRVCTCSSGLFEPSYGMGSRGSRPYTVHWLHAFLLTKSCTMARTMVIIMLVSASKTNSF